MDIIWFQLTQYRKIIKHVVCKIESLGTICSSKCQKMQISRLSRTETKQTVMKAGCNFLTCLINVHACLVHSYVLSEHSFLLGR